MVKDTTMTTSTTASALEIVDGHKIIFSAWARNSRLEGRIDSITFLAPGVAQLVAYGHIVYQDHRSSDQNKRTITARRDPDGWSFVSYQNTLTASLGEPVRRSRCQRDPRYPLVPGFHCPLLTRSRWSQW
jgi:hypothetical protein